MRHVSVAAVQMGMKEVEDFDGFKTHIRYLLDNCHEADLVVFPEYTGLELITTYKDWRRLPVSNWAAALEPFSTDFEALFATEAKMRGQVITASTIYMDTDLNAKNRTYLFHQDGIYEVHDKTRLIHREQKWGAIPGDEMEMFPVRFANIGINVCYEVEFPECARQLVEQDTEILIVPSATFSLRGLNRVRQCARTRAIENQMYVVNACLSDQTETLGTAALSGIYSPVDLGFSQDGIVAALTLDGETVLIERLDMELLQDIRQSSSANTYKDYIGD